MDISWTKFTKRKSWIMDLQDAAASPVKKQKWFVWTVWSTQVTIAPHDVHLSNVRCAANLDTLRKTARKSLIRLGTTRRNSMKKTMIWWCIGVVIVTFVNKVYKNSLPKGKIVLPKPNKGKIWSALMQYLSFGEKFVFIKVINGTIKQNNVGSCFLMYLWNGKNHGDGVPSNE